MTSIDPRIQEIRTARPIDLYKDHVSGHEDFPLWQYIHDDSVNTDPTTWWAPNEKGLEMMCKACGFKHMEVTGGAAQLPQERLDKRSATRIWMHAYK